MTDAKLNPELTELNKKQLADSFSRSQIRQQRRQVLENILANREEFISQAKRPKIVTRLFMVFLLLVMFFGGYCVYYLLTHG